MDLVPRYELLAWLHRYRRQPLTLVSAPAGYGETTLVSHWIDTLERPTAWLPCFTVTRAILTCCCATCPSRRLT